jgi:cytidine deaminase
MTPEKLIAEAAKIQGKYALGHEDMTAGAVAAAIVARSGRIYTGICIEVACGMGFCSEHAAIAEMLKHRETAFEMVVAVSKSGVEPPCGRCRELMAQIDPANLEAKVILANDVIVTLNELLPHRWIP